MCRLLVLTLIVLTIVAVHCLSIKKFVNAKKVVDKLPSLASEVGMKEVTERIDVLQCIHDIWVRDGKVIIVEEGDALGDNEGTTGLWKCLPAWEVVLSVFFKCSLC